jgi:hypothetical protein
MRVDLDNRGKLRSMIALARLLLAALALGLLAGMAWSQGVTPRTVVLGQSAPLSGPLQAHGEDIRNGALAYFRKLNAAGGVHGRRIELATLDDAGDAAATLANTHRFIEEFKVFALFGYAGAGMTPPGVGELDLEVPFGDRARLSDQLVETLFLEHTVAVGVDVATVGRSG